MRYREHVAPRLWGMWAFILFVLLIVPLCWLPELTTPEATATLIAREMKASGDYITPKLFGAEVFTLPVMPWLLSFAPESWLNSELAVRAATVIPLGLLVLLVGWVSYRMLGANAGGAAAGAAMSAAVVVFQKGIWGEEKVLFALLVNGAWLVWFFAGRMKRRWLLAWFISHLLVSAAILTGGFTAIFLFYFPLLWLRKPLNIWRRLLQWDHWISLGANVLLLGVGMYMVPVLWEHVGGFFPSWAGASAGEYFKSLVKFPLMTIAGTFPWVFLAWPAFCQAFRPLEKHPVLANYLRTIMTSIFVVYWFIPLRDAGPSEILPLIGPFSILIAMNYDLLVRRHGRQLLYITRFAAIVTLVVAGAWLVGTYFGSLDWSAVGVWVHSASVMLFCCAVVLAAFCLKWQPKLPVWMMVIVSVLMLKWLFVSTDVTQRYIEKSDRRRVAQKLASVLPKGVTVYDIVHKDADQSYAAEWFYVHHPIITTANPTEDLPNRVQEVYVIGGPEEPLASDWEWRPLHSEPIHYHDERRFRAWHGLKNADLFHWHAAEAVQGPSRLRVSRLGSWISRNGGELRQDKPANQPLWMKVGLSNRPSLRFDGGESLYRLGLDAQIEVEHSIVMIVRLQNFGEKRQTILELFGEGPKEKGVLVELTYDPGEKVLHSESRDSKGKVLALSRPADLNDVSVIVFRRNKSKVELSVNGVDPASAPNTLGPIEAKTLGMTVGASGGAAKPTHCMIGKIAEIRIYNRWLQDSTLNELAKLLLDSYNPSRYYR